MSKETAPAIPLESIVHRILEIRGQRVMLDADLAVLYGVETGALVRAMKRNIKRFEDFAFQLSNAEWESLRCQFGTSNKGRGGRRFVPYAFTDWAALVLRLVVVVCIALL